MTQNLEVKLLSRKAGTAAISTTEPLPHERQAIPAEGREA
jgi:hypothetical protein